MCRGTREPFDVDFTQIRHTVARSSPGHGGSEVRHREHKLGHRIGREDKSCGGRCRHRTGSTRTGKVVQIHAHRLRRRRSILHVKREVRVIRVVLVHHVIGARRGIHPVVPHLRIKPVGGYRRLEIQPHRLAVQRRSRVFNEGRGSARRSEMSRAAIVQRGHPCVVIVRAAWKRRIRRRVGRSECGGRRKERRRRPCRGVRGRRRIRRASLRVKHQVVQVKGRRLPVGSRLDLKVHHPGICLGVARREVEGRHGDRHLLPARRQPA